MAEKLRPRYPIFVPSRGRYTNPMTCKWLIEDGVPFRLVVGEEELDLYRRALPGADIIVCPVAGQLLRVRNWIRDLAIEEGWDRHWQLDDNMHPTRRLFRGQRIRC